MDGLAPLFWVLVGVHDPSQIVAGHALLLDHRFGRSILDGKAAGLAGIGLHNRSLGRKHGAQGANAINAGNERFFIGSPSGFGMRRHPRVAPSMGNNAVIVGTDFLLRHRAQAAPMNFLTAAISASGAMRATSCSDWTGTCWICGYSLVIRSTVAGG